MARTPHQQAWQMIPEQGHQNVNSRMTVVTGEATITSGDTTVDVGTPFGGSSVIFAAGTPETVGAATLDTIGPVGSDMVLTSNELTFAVGATYGSDVTIKYMICGFMDFVDSDD